MDGGRNLGRWIRAAAVPAALALLLAAGLAAPAGAQQHPNQQRGFSPDQVYDFLGLDTIQGFNGNLNITLPLFESSAGGGLGYGLSLHYSGNIWDSRQECGASCLTEFFPNARSNAGPGWLLSFGRLLGPGNPIPHSADWVYEDPSGADHEFRVTLHESDPDDPGDAGANQAFWYSRDGSHLRLRAATREVEFPSGEIHKFDSQGKIIQIRDRFGNEANVSYPNLNTWLISDPFRTHTVTFKPEVYYGRVVDKVVVAAFNGAQATYTFNYTPHPIKKPCMDQSGVATETVPLLTSIALPHGLAFSMPVSDYETGEGLACSDFSGHIRGMKLPVGGRIEWDYQKYSFPAESAPSPPLDRAVGVSKRRLRDAAGLVTGEWTYTTELFPPQAGCVNPPRQLRNTVVDPLGHRTESYFSVFAAECPFGTWDRDEYALPLTREVSDGTSPARYLSTRTYNAAGSLLRSSFVRYVKDHAGGGKDSNRRLESQRTTFEDGTRADATYSSFDGLGHYRTETTAGNFGAGDVRTTTTSFNPTRGTFPGSFSMLLPSEPWVLGTYDFQDVSEAGATARSEFCFDPATGFLQRRRVLEAGTARGANDLVTVYERYGAADPNGRPGDLKNERFHGGDLQSLGTGALCGLALPAEQYWLGHTYQSGSLKTSEHFQAGGATSVGFKLVNYDIDSNTGLVRTSRDSALLATTYEYDLLRRPTAVRPSGQAWTSYAYINAVGTSKALVRIRRYPEGTATGEYTSEEMQFDAFGRLFRELRRMPPSTAGGLDRWAKRTHLYNALGSQTDVSEWEPDGPAHTSWTKYRDFDPFGRPGRIVPPDGPAHQIDLGYAGVRAASRTTRVATGAAGAETTSTTTERYDRQGRLWQVTEPSEPVLDAGGNVIGHNDVTTFYGYDVGGRLASVSTTSGGTTQTRTFKFDNRGFLEFENHPEKTANVLGLGHDVDYQLYDARGRAGRKVDGANDLRFSYDRAERLTQVATGAGTLLKAYTFGTGVGASDRSLGKVKTAQRSNYPVGQTAVFTDTYTYGGLGGRVSARETALTFNGVTNERWNLGLSYDQLGNVTSLTYPDCAFAACTPSPRTVAYTYDEGRTATVGGFASGVTYHLNGMVDKVTHAAPNGVVDTVSIAADSMLRPLAIDAKKGAATLWASGSYGYDGAGNVEQIGSGFFRYDPVSRLVSGTVYDGASGGGSAKTQDYRFDAFGNITRITTNGVQVQTPTATATNRLSGGAYDPAGNLVAWNGQSYEYDAFNQMTRFCSTTPCPGGAGEDWLYLYDASDERIWSFKTGASPRFDRFTLRGMGSEVLREYANSGYTFSDKKDYVYRDGQLLASVSSQPAEGTRHFHLDHLGTPRAITSANGTLLSYHAYHGFGGEATVPTQDAERMKFTGHERDLASPAGTADDLDYMHARHCSPLTARFLSTDPSPRSIRLAMPQSWNRYAYVMNGPLKYIDPYGELWFRINNRWVWKNEDQIATESKDKNGNAVLTVIYGRGTFVAFNGGELTLYKNDGTTRTFTGTSGELDRGRTQPGLQNVRDRGPIPEGQYWFNSTAIESYKNISGWDKIKSAAGGGTWRGGRRSWGDQRVELTPDASNATTRSGFYIHGGYTPGSRGCIDLCAEAGDFFSAVGMTAGEVLVEVDYP